jgi:hypothetical protein
VRQYSEAHRGCPFVKPLPPASQGGSATRHDGRLRRRTLRLRCAPPSASSNSSSARRAFIQTLTRGEAGQSERERAPEAKLQQPASRERLNDAPRPPRIHSEGSRPERASCEAGCERSKTLRALKQRASAPEDSLRGEPARASESGHLKRSFSSPPVASAQYMNCSRTMRPFSTV